MHPVILSVGPITIYSFGVFALLGFLSASFVIWKRGVENHFPEEEIFDSLIILSLIGLIGARLHYLLANFRSLDYLIVNFLAFIKIPGLIFFGGLLSGVAGLYFICKKKRWEFFNVSDVFVTGLSLGQAIGWLGALLAGFGAGKESLRFGLNFIGSETPRFPSQLIWFIGWLVIFSFLWKVENKYRLFDWYKGKRVTAEAGFLTFSYVIGFGLLKFLVVLTSQASLYWYGVAVEALSAGVLLLFGLTGLYLRSGRAFRSDVGRTLTACKRTIRRGLVFLKQKGRHGFRKLRRSRH